MSEYDDLINQFGSKGKAIADTSTVATPYADLINQFGSGQVKAEPSSSYFKGDSLFVKQGDSVEIPTNYVPAGAPVNGIQEYKTKEAAAAPAKTPEFQPTPVSQYPFIKQGIEGLKSSSSLAGKGYVDIAQGKPATGLGEVALGHMGQALNITGVAPVIETATEGLNKILPVDTKVNELNIAGNPTGNKYTIASPAERIAAVATSGLPVGKTAQVITDISPSSRAVKTLVDAIGPENIPNVVQQLKSNPRLTLMDVDPNTQVISQGLAAKPGDPRNILDKVVAARKDSQKDVVTNAYDDAMGLPVNVRDKVEELKNNVKQAGKEINPVITNSGPVDLTPVIASMDAKIKPGVNSVISMGDPLPLPDIQKDLVSLKKFITDGKSMRTDPQSLHNFQSALRAKAEDLLSSANGQDRQRGYALMNVRNQVVDAIDAAGATPGEYKAKLANYRDQNDITDAFKKGQLVTRNRLGNLEDDPSYWDNWIKNATPAELEAAKEGARLAVAHQMSSIPNAARKGMTIPDVEFNSEKLKLLFGKDEVETMAKSLADEKKIADTNSRMTQGSMTAMRLLGADATKVRPDYEPGFTKTLLPVALEAGTQYLSGGSLPAAGLAAGIAYPYLRGKITKIGQSLDRSTNVEIANLASATGEARENLIKALQNHIPKGKLSLAQKSMLALPVSNP